MVVEQITITDLLSGCRADVGLAPEAQDAIDEPLLGALVRRAAGFLCPCPQTALRNAVLESLEFLGDESLAEDVDAAVEGLLVGGDLLELTDVTIDDRSVRGSWVFAAPPRFVVRPSGSIFVLGIVPDHNVFLPEEIAARVVYEGFTRVVPPTQGEDVGDVLRDHGLQELSDAVWLRGPKLVSAETLIEGVTRDLGLAPSSGSIEGLVVLDHTERVTYYRGRWTVPKRHTGVFIGRRPQDYGAAIWCAVELKDGTAARFVDLPASGYRWRGCDAAWHLQMAIDAKRGAPQRYRREPDRGGTRLDFFSPLPLWAQRRLMVIGRPTGRNRSLVSFLLPEREAAAEEAFLQERLWLSPMDAVE